jgi:uncharacterized membrane protein
MYEERTPRLDLICILALSVEWLYFGSYHFTMRHATEAQIPGFLPWKSHITVVTGIVEVTTGILILLRRTRRIAAYSSLALLVAFVPSIYIMLIDDHAMMGFVPYVSVVRAILVPNHVLLVLAAIHLLQSQDLAKVRTAQLLEAVLAGHPTPGDPRQPWKRTATPIIATVMLLANLAGFAIIRTSARGYATVHLWGMTCLATGALVGFLFGVPRVSMDRGTRVTHRPNSNIEVVSDWLTKIIVGVGLVEFRNLAGFLNALADDLAQSLTPPARVGFAQALIVYFFVAGVIQGYLLTRMYLSRQFEAEESRLALVDPATSPPSFPLA